MMPIYAELLKTSAVISFKHNGTLYTYTANRVFQQIIKDHFWSEYTTLRTYYLVWADPRYSEPKSIDNFTKLCYSASLIVSKSDKGILQIEKHFPFVGEEFSEITLYEN